MKKRIQNGKRGRGARKKEEAGTDAASRPAGAEAGEGPLDDVMLDHLRMVTSQIEGREVSREEIEEMFREFRRQRSMGGRRWLDYLVEQLKEDPEKDPP